MLQLFYLNRGRVMVNVSGAGLKWMLCILLALLVSAQTVMADAVEYSVARWPAVQGNHRAVVSVTESAPAVWAHLLWRRRDARPTDKEVLVQDLKTGRFIQNVAKINLTQDFGDIVFQPETVPGEYAIYYYPLKRRERRPMGTTNFEYLPPANTASEKWLEENGLDPGRYFEANAFEGIPRAKVLRFEARSEMDRFDPMELPATKEELEAVRRFNQGRPFLLYAEDRKHPIRMREKIPYIWAQRTPGQPFQGTALRSEWYAFQIGVFALSKSVQNIQASWSDLKSEAGGVIPASAIRCITLQGVDAAGQPMSRVVDIPESEVRALWFMVEVPESASPGMYQGKVTIRDAAGASQSVDVNITVSSEVLADHGVSELWRLARLNWLNSQAGQEDAVTKPYTPMKVDGQIVHAYGKEVTLGDDGLPRSIKVGGNEVLASPVRLLAMNMGDLPIQWMQKKLDFEVQSDSVVAWQGVSQSGGLTATVKGRMEYDGYIFLIVTLQSRSGHQLKDIRIHVPYRPEAAEYFMGFAKGAGGYRPSGDIEWKWSDRPTNKVWMGSVEAGLQVKLRGPASEENIWSNYKPEESGIPESWSNGGQGGALITAAANNVTLQAYTGPVVLQLAESRELCLSLIPTPVKPRDPQHWTNPNRWKMRYSMLASVAPGQSKALGANDVTAFHATPANPWINYPFIADERLKRFVAEAHEAGMNARLYYTVRELSNQAAELWPLWSMREEFFAPGKGEGGPWLREHLLGGYSPAWSSTPEGHEGNPDDSLHVTGWNRWLNYYVQSLIWLMEHRQIDGLYFDGVSCGRKTLQRLRKVGDAARPNFRMDFHSGNTITRRSNAFNDSLELLPYLDSTWIGEGFNYNGSPDFYMVELSGIPFGIPNDMLQYGGNPWRGMIYGMVPRYIENHSASPLAMWQFWDQIGIETSRMIGYWDKKAPVKTSRSDVLATTYQMAGKALIAVASWAREDVACQMEIDYAALGLDPAKVKAYAPEIAEFQVWQAFDLSKEITIPQGRGFLIVLTDQPVEKPAGDMFDAQPVAFDSSSVHKDWSWRAPSGSDSRFAVDASTLTISGSRSTYGYLERPLAQGVSGVQTQMLVRGLRQERVWHDRHDGLNAPGLAVVFDGGKQVRVSFASQGVLLIEDGILDHMYKPALVLRNQPEDAWVWLRITWDDQHVHVGCSVDGQNWELVRALPRSIYGEAKSVLVGKIAKTYGWPRTLEFRNADGTQAGAFRELMLLRK